MSLEEKRHQLTVDTLKEVIDNLTQVMNIRNQDVTYDLYFNAATIQMNYQIQMNVAASTITGGSLITTSNSTVFQQTIYPIRQFPLIFLHQVAVLSSVLCSEVTYMSNHTDKVDLAVVDKFLEKANSISCIFSDPKFTEIDFRQYLIEKIPEHLMTHLEYKDSCFYVRFSGLIGASDILAPNVADCQIVKDVEKKIHHIIKALKYLRTDVCRWSLDE
ncbi:hypothetical protein TRFO_10758 [Tritrichomonas foetus]|uniref:Uncharacterized protein n=1 Tax=Tritrichomonas foetus TaxID=1144522 RepID=A0A1J4J9Z1_9EUKA|nr:hypothetical protein TRFO_10758 [Tritrichomonas foetus]|eukprot:OHS95039.1 hypothetical protein TRFO_10758 [Tritrichomonas foetus]